VYLSSKHEAQSPNPSTAKKEEKEEEAQFSTSKR
jgi:hypothetical protein